MADDLGHADVGFKIVLISLHEFSSIINLANMPINKNKPLAAVNLMPYLTGKNESHTYIYIFMQISYSNAYGKK